MKIVVLGGSFDPIHHGHLAIGLVIREVLDADHVRLIPAGEQPFKAGQHGASAEHRALMAELATRDDPAFVIDRIEVERSGPSYTVDTLRTLRERFPDASLSLALGSDAAELFSKWREPDAIRTLAEVVVFSRSGERPPEGVADRVVAVPRIDISSTAVRERVRSGRSIRYWVPDPVARHIASHGLYRD